MLEVGGVRVILRRDMDEPLKIAGELTPDPTVCLFHLNRPLAEDLTLSFRNKEEGDGSPLVDALFAIEGVAQVAVSGSTITVTKNSQMPWPHLAPDIARAIRGVYDQPKAPIAPSVIDAIKNAPMDGVEEEVADLFEEHINPALASHGGFVKLVKVEGRDVFVEMGGGCQGCASSKATLRYGVESAIRRVAPQVRNIVDVTDHAAGTKPYYR
jgi:Fe-S cluster biogenesis protein NfuA